MANNNFYDIVSHFYRQHRILILITVFIILFSLVASFAYGRFYVNSNEKMKSFEDVANNKTRGKPVQVYFFFVDWCPHCKTAHPEWSAFKEEFNGKKINDCDIECIEVNSTDKDDNDPMMAEFNIKAYPTVFLLKDDYRVDFDAKITKKTLEQFVLLGTQ